MPASASFANLSRTRQLTGKSIPGIIRNGQHFFTELEVFEDGAVECWGLVDLAGFRQKLASGWVRTAVPDGQTLSVHGLGHWTIGEGQWQYDAAGYYAFVHSLVEELNPPLLNLYTYVERKRNGVTIGESGRGRVYTDEDPQQTFPKRTWGARTHLLYRDEQGADFLIDLNVFANGQLHLSRLPKVVVTDLFGLHQLAQAGRILAEPVVGQRLTIHGLGSFRVERVNWAVATADKLLEVNDLLAQARGESTSLERCRAAYEAFMAAPTVAGREQLRQAYEAIPRHERHYVGDMDTKDTAVRMIIYGEQEIEFWSHYAVAKAQGLPLPRIRVPRPTDED